MWKSAYVGVYQLRTYLFIMGVYTISKVWYQYVIRHNDKTYSNNNTNVVLKSCNALYPNVCGNDIIIRLKWAGGFVNSYINP